MVEKSCLTVILAAGEGTRMRSARAKVMHPVAGLPMLGHVIAAARAAQSDRLAIVHGPAAAEVQAFAAKAAIGTDCVFFEQRERLGTAHAVLAARPALANEAGHVLVLFGDTPLMRPENLQNARKALQSGLDLVVLGFRAADPHGYGRLLLDGDGALTAIVEERDATDAQRRVDLCNAGVMAFSGKHALGLLSAIGNDNAKGEYYMTDAVHIARERGLKVGVVECPEDDVMGINTRAQLAEAEALFQSRLRSAAMDRGVTLIAPQTVFLCHDTVLSRDVTIEPHVVFGPGVLVGEGALIRAFCHLEGAKIDANAEIGPYARLRPGAQIGEKARIGNFVEVKNVDVGAGAKANHLAYLGDGSIGERANIGAGTIFCNYDGINKHETHIGAGAFVGSNSALVAPVTIGAGAMIGSGSVITSDVSADALALGRGRQVEKPGWAAEFRRRTVKKKKQ